MAHEEAGETGRAGGAATCAVCGAETDRAPLTWTTSAEQGRTVYYCDKCSRDNLRAIESGLERQWW